VNSRFDEHIPNFYNYKPELFLGFTFTKSKLEFSHREKILYG